MVKNLSSLFLKWLYRVSYNHSLERQNFNREWEFYANGHNGSFIYRSRTTGLYVENP